MYSGFIIIVTMTDLMFDEALQEWGYIQWVERNRIKVGIETFLDVYRTRGICIIKGWYTMNDYYKCPICVDYLVCEMLLSNPPEYGCRCINHCFNMSYNKRKNPCMPITMQEIIQFIKVND